MYVKLIAVTEDAVNTCEQAAATCYDSQPSEDGRIIKSCARAGHLSVWEHMNFTFHIKGISRACLAQLTRHRLASFSVQSQRYVKMNDWKAVIPDTITKSKFLQEADEQIRHSMELYRRMVEAGIPAEDVRYLTPQAITTNLVLTMNARELRHFFSLRCCNRAQWEIRHLADEMLRLCRKEAPILFEAAGPGCVTGNCPESRPCGQPRNKSDWEA